MELLAQADGITKEVDHWMQTTVVYGLAFVFLAVICLIFLRFLWRLADNLIAVIGAIRQWLPTWFAAQIESHKAVVASATGLTESMKDVREAATAHLEQGGITQSMVGNLARAGLAASNNPQVHEHLVKVINQTR